MTGRTPPEDRGEWPATGWKGRSRAAYHRVPAAARPWLVAAVGTAVVVAGLVMLVLPGPGLLTLAAGLAILALEFPWARRLLAAIRARAEGTARRAGWPASTRHRE
jgi:uncharacterized protein (TIGR02611 family)